MTFRSQFLIYLGKCAQLSANEIAAFPIFTFVLDGVKLNYPPQQYLRYLILNFVVLVLYYDIVVSLFTHALTLNYTHL